MTRGADMTNPQIIVFQVPVIACVPVDTTELCRLAPSVQDLIPKPSIEYTIVKCQGCGQDVWIGPKQQEMARTVKGSEVLCYICVFRQGDFATAPVIGLDPEADSVPRRT